MKNLLLLITISFGGLMCASTGEKEQIQEMNIENEQQVVDYDFACTWCGKYDGDTYCATANTCAEAAQLLKEMAVLH